MNLALHMRTDIGEGTMKKRDKQPKPAVKRTTETEVEGREPDILAALDSMRAEIEQVGAEHVTRADLYRSVRILPLSHKGLDWVWSVCYSTPKDD